MKLINILVLSFGIVVNVPRYELDDSRWIDRSRHRWAVYTRMYFASMNIITIIDREWDENVSSLLIRNCSSTGLIEHSKGWFTSNEIPFPRIVRENRSRKSFEERNYVPMFSFFCFIFEKKIYRHICSIDYTSLSLSLSLFPCGNSIRKNSIEMFIHSNK